MDSRYRFASVPPSPAVMRASIGDFLKEKHRQPSPENRKLVCDYLDENGLVYSNENVRSAIQTLGPKLKMVVQDIRPMDRTVPIEELQTMLAQIMAANPWIADTASNGRKIAEEFYSQRTPPTKSQTDLLDAIKRISAQLERPAPVVPVKPQFVDEDLTQLLPDGSEKLPLSVDAMRYSKTNLQRRNLMERLRREEEFKKA